MNGDFDDLEWLAMDEYDRGRWRWRYRPVKLSIADLPPDVREAMARMDDIERQVQEANEAYEAKLAKLKAKTD